MVGYEEVIFLMIKNFKFKKNVIYLKFEKMR